MINGLCESPLTFQAISIWRNELLNEEIMLRDVIDLETTFTEIGDSDVLDAELKTNNNNEHGNQVKPLEKDKENESALDNLDGGMEEEEEEDSINVSLAAMEHSLTPHVLNILEQIDNKYVKLKDLEKKRMKATSTQIKNFPIKKK